MGRVRMVHLNLPGQEIEIPEAAEPGHRATGWIRKDEAPAEPTGPAPAGPAPDSQPSAAATRRSPSPAVRDKE